MIVRNVDKEEFNKIYDFVKEAFSTAEVSDGSEQDFQQNLRNSDKYIPELEFVASDGETILGHIMLTKTIVTASSGSVEHLLLAPLSVQINYRNKGIGGRLIEKACAVAAEMAYGAVFLVGNPLYYCKYGFCESSKYGITCENVDSKYVLCRQLKEDALKGISGKISIQ